MSDALMSLGYGVFRYGASYWHHFELQYRIDHESESVNRSKSFWKRTLM